MLPLQPLLSSVLLLPQICAFSLYPLILAHMVDNVEKGGSFPLTIPVDYVVSPLNIKLLQIYNVDIKNLQLITARDGFSVKFHQDGLSIEATDAFLDIESRVAYMLLGAEPTIQIRGRMYEISLSTFINYATANLTRCITNIGRLKLDIGFTLLGPVLAQALKAPLRRIVQNAICTDVLPTVAEYLVPAIMDIGPEIFAGQEARSLDEFKRLLLGENMTSPEPPPLLL